MSLVAFCVGMAALVGAVIVGFDRYTERLRAVSDAVAVQKQFHDDVAAEAQISGARLEQLKELLREANAQMQRQSERQAKAEAGYERTYARLRQDYAASDKGLAESFNVLNEAAQRAENLATHMDGQEQANTENLAKLCRTMAQEAQRQRDEIARTLKRLDDLDAVPTK